MFLDNVLSAETKPLWFPAFTLYFLNKWLKIVDNESAIKEADCTVNQSQKEFILLIPQIFFSRFFFFESPPSDIGEHLFSQLYSIYDW